MVVYHLNLNCFPVFQSSAVKSNCLCSHFYIFCNNNKMIKPGKAAQASEVCAEMISASGEVWISAMIELCQRLLDEKGMPDEWQTRALVSIFMEKRDVRNCNTCRGVKLLKHAMKIVERVLERRLRELVYIDSMQGFEI